MAGRTVCYTLVGCNPLTPFKFVRGFVVSRVQLVPTLTSTKFIKTTKKFFTFDVSTSIRGLHQKKLVGLLGLLLPVLGAIS